MNLKKDPLTSQDPLKIKIAFMPNNLPQVHIKIPAIYKDKRIDFALSHLLSEYSRSQITAAIKKGDATINNKTFKPKDKVLGDEEVDIIISHTATNNWQADAVKLDIVYSDDDVIVINKPQGLVTHPGAGNRNNTLANGLLNYDNNLKKIARAGIVHRLDKDTSGLLVVVKNEKTRLSLIKQLQSHKVLREYWAVVSGHIISGGVIDNPIGRNPKNRIKKQVSQSGKKAVTHYRVVERFKNHTLVKLILETGRTHQIRVHLQHIGYPIIGDKLYGGRAKFPKNCPNELKKILINFPRQALHASKLTFTHPSKNKNVTFSAKLSADIENLLNILRKYDKIS